MSKTPGYVQAGIPQLKDLRAKLLHDEKTLKAQDRNTAVNRIEDAKRRKTSKSAERKHAAKLMAESLVKNPRQGLDAPRKGVWEYSDDKKLGAPKSEAGKPKGKRDLHPVLVKKERKAKQAEARRIAKEARQAEKQKAREERKAAKEAARAARKAEQEKRKAERQEAKRLASLPDVVATPEMIENVLKVIGATYSLKGKKEDTMRAFVKRYAGYSSQRQVRMMKRFEKTLLIFQTYRMEADAQIRAQGAGLDAVAQAEAVQAQAEQPKKKVAKKAPAKKAVKVAKPVKAVKKLVAKGKGSWAKASRTMK